MAKSHKAQHWIPRSYLRAWTDPAVPPGQEPFVHVFAKDGSSHRRKAPANLFSETDLYTIKLADGVRDLRLEHGLAGLETAFFNIQRNHLSKRQQLPVARRRKLMAFVAALHSRTPAVRDHHLKFWTEIQEMGEKLERRMKTATQAEKRAAAVSLPLNDRASLTLDDVRRLTASPMEYTLVPLVTAQLPYLMLMRVTVLCANCDPGFITSDAPVVWFDPEWHKLPPLYRSVSLSAPLLEITVPISPAQMLVIRHQNDFDHPQRQIEYMDVLEHHVAELNRRTRFQCDKEFVVRRQITHPRWFEQDPMPPDAWEAVHGMENPLGSR